MTTELTGLIVLWVSNSGNESCHWQGNPGGRQQFVMLIPKIIRLPAGSSRVLLSTEISHRTLQRVYKWCIYSWSSMLFMGHSLVSLLNTSSLWDHLPGEVLHTEHRRTGSGKGHSSQNLWRCQVGWRSKLFADVLCGGTLSFAFISMKNRFNTIMKSIKFVTNF